MTYKSEGAEDATCAVILSFYWCIDGPLILCHRISDHRGAGMLLISAHRCWVSESCRESHTIKLFRTFPPSHYLHVLIIIIILNIVVTK